MVIDWKLDDRGNPNVVERDKARAAAYVRMSTEHQKYSTDNQLAAIRKYADRRGFEISKTYTDAGKSGLRLIGRDALQALLNDLESGSSDFSAVLVYDVSRWGRFQDPDEAAAIELRCKRMGVVVHYCAEQFENDGSIGSTIVKTVKRAMAGEYSRELSVKVFSGQANLIRLGFRQGGSPNSDSVDYLSIKQGSLNVNCSAASTKALLQIELSWYPAPPVRLISSTKSTRCSSNNI